MHSNNLNIINDLLRSLKFFNSEDDAHVRILILDSVRRLINVEIMNEEEASDAKECA